MGDWANGVPHDGVLVNHTTIAYAKFFSLSHPVSFVISRVLPFPAWSLLGRPLFCPFSRFLCAATGAPPTPLMPSLFCMDPGCP